MIFKGAHREVILFTNLNIEYYETCTSVAKKDKCGCHNRDGCTTRHRFLCWSRDSFGARCDATGVWKWR
jgi:hypothetical protein